MSLSLDESRQRLVHHFEGDNIRKESKWDELWAKGEFLPWDRNMPNPALGDVLSDRHDLLPAAVSKDQDGGDRRRRRRALVPGCGAGYDVLLLASFGYDACGLELSQAAVRRCLEMQEQRGTEYPVRNAESGAGKAAFVQGDFFESDWLARAGGDKFDLIYDYTFLSCIPPHLRHTWASRMSQLLAKDGRLICLEFPSTKDPKLPGPPWGLPPAVYMEHLTRPGETIEYDHTTCLIREDPARQVTTDGLIRMDHWQPSRTHKIGEGSDWISVWRHQ